MGILRLRFAIYILMAVLAIQKLSQKPNITSSSNSISTNDLAFNSFVEANNTATSAPTKPKAMDTLVIPKPSEQSVTKEATAERLPSPIALPEALVIQEIAPEDSRNSTFPGVQLDHPARKQKIVGLTVVSTAPEAGSTSSAVLEAEETSSQTSAQKDGSTPMEQSAAPQQALATEIAAKNSYSTGDLQGVPTLARSAMFSDTPTREVVEQDTLSQSRPETETEAPGVNDSLTEPLNTDLPPSSPVTLKAPETTDWTTSASSAEVEMLQATSLPPVAPEQTIQVAQAPSLVELQKDSDQDLPGVPPLNQKAIFLANRDTSTPKETTNPQQSEDLVAQATPAQSRPEVERLQNELRTLEETPTKSEFQSSPALSIVIPTGFGADNNTAFISATYQSRTRDVSDLDDGGIGVGIGLGDARKAVGVELSYAAASFGNSRNFGSGGFNVKVHRLVRDDLAVAVGWNGFLNVGDRNDFEQSFYGVASKIFRTRDDINLPFSRVAVTAGIGNGQFETENSVARGDNNVNVFGNVALRVAQPVSLIAEWSGQDLGVGLSIAPFKNFPLVITPAVRDLVGAGDEPRFVLSTGFAFRF